MSCYRPRRISAGTQWYFPSGNITSSSRSNNQAFVLIIDSMIARGTLSVIRSRPRSSYNAHLLAVSRHCTDSTTFHTHSRGLATSSALYNAAPKTRDRGPTSKEDTQTDFTAMNVLGSMPVPTSAIDSCMDDGFAFNSGLRIKGAGTLLAAGEAFAWRPWVTKEKHTRVRLINSKGQLEVSEDAWGLLDLMWPKPDLLVVGTGENIAPLSPATRRRLNDLGIRVEVQDTRNAAAQFNLLATERGIQQIAAALIPIGWRDSK